MRNWKQRTLVGIFTLAFAFVGCDNGTGGSENQDPIATDFNISGTGTFPYDGNPKAVTVTAKEGKTGGEITVKYNNESDTLPSNVAPSEVGTYTVTFDVTAAAGWNEASGLFAGTLTIEQVPENHSVITYNGNGNTGGEVPADSNLPYENGVTVTVLGNTGDLAKTGYTFADWNTADDGNGTSYKEGDAFTINNNTTLYAQWTPVNCTVTYNGNGNTGGEVPTDDNSPYQYGATVTVLGNTGDLVNTGKTFTGWNTAANGSGTRYAPDATFTINNNTTLYAHWGEWEQGPTASPLTVNVWVDGSIAEEIEEWFSFTATAAKQYIHLNYTGLGYANVQVYTDLGAPIGDNQRLSSGYGNQRPDATGSFSRGLEIGQEYYIRVQQAGDGTYYKGAYRIAFTETDESPNMITIPEEGVVSLTANNWANGETDYPNKDQWYSFTTSEGACYVHILPGTATAFWIQMYGSNGGTVGNPVYSSGDRASGPWELETGKTYYIRFPSDYSGTFQMAFNDSTTPPPIALPTGDATTLTADTWEDGTTDGGEWYHFIANADTQYVHFNFTTATGANVKVYDSIGNMVGTPKSAPVYTPSFSLELTNGSEYYLHVTLGSYDGAFQVAFSASETPPAIMLPSEDITELTANTWATGSTTYNGKQWFRFTANASPQYVHLSGISIEISIRLYDSNGIGVGNPSRIGPQANNYFLSQPVTNGQVYYVKAEGRGYSNDNYQITFNDSETPPELE